MKQKRKKWNRFPAAFLCLLLSLLLPVHPAAAGEAPTRVTFENAQNDTPDLYVSKKVESASGNYEMPADLRFPFVLKLDGKLAGQLEYRVFDEAGTEIFRYADGESTEAKPNKIPYQTDRSGTFTLAPGQTAKFEYVGTGTAYEVTEMPAEGWTQIQPPGGAPAAGTVTEKGAWAQFVNLTGGGGVTRLIVRKDITFPAGYVCPETPDFPFALTVDGKPYGEEPYTVTDTKTGAELGTRTTGPDGSFSLKGGQTAVFSEIPQDVDYRVTEGRTEGWWAVGETEQEGTTGTGGAVPVVFTNGNASFAVTKRMEDDSRPDTAFTFELLKADYSLWEGAAYLLYQTNGEPVLGESGEQAAGVTDGNGQFSLKPGQTALFTGIEPGSVYSVSEIGHPDYIQTVPREADGYRDQVVSAAVEVLPFVNKPSLGGLTVTKVVENTDGNAPLEKKEFSFLLSRKTAEGAGEPAYEPVADAVYSVEVGGSQNSYRTDEKGGFTLKRNESARFEGLKPGTYRIEEQVSGELEYEPEQAVQEVEITREAPNVSVTFVNRYASRFFDLYLVKTDRADQGKALEGAAFMLYRDALNQNPVQEEPFVTDKEGKITIPDLKTGTYYLVETEAPAGYQLLANPIKITVCWKGPVMEVTVDDKTITSQEEDDQIYIQQVPDGKDEVHIKIYNNKNFGLPLTGGTGTLLFGGGVLLAMAVLFLTLWKLGKKKNMMPQEKEEKQE